LKSLVPEQSGLVFSPVKEEALKASKGGTPFGLLFLGFSFFLIASSLLLVGLLFRLNLERRAKELGLLFAEGFTRRRVAGLLLAEGAVVALVGSMLGGMAGLLYSRFLVRLLTVLWPGGALESFLRPHWTWVSLLAGMGGALAVSLATIAWVARGMAKTPPRILLAGRTSSEEEPGGERPRRWHWLLAIALPLLGLILLPIGSLVEGHEARAGTFFGSGALFLAGGLFALRAWMSRSSHHRVEGHGFGPILRLGILNATRYPLRSMLTVGLLASSAFLLVAVESFRRRAESTDGVISGPDGGFALLAESDLPLLRDPNSPAGRKEILDSYERALTRGTAAGEIADRVKQAEQLLQQTKIVALRASKGDDASCLNLYEPRSPRILGVPASLIGRGGFHFQNSLAKSAEDRNNPWLLLNAPGDDVPCFGEANTVMWMLKSGLGKTVSLADETLRSVPVRIVGLLQDSVFQSGLLVSEERFLRLFPDQEGYTHFLIAPPSGGSQDEVKRILETALEDRGFAVTRSADRLESFLAVENTYLTTFQALGGLGLILGSLGLAVVLLRSIWERRSELALLRALGWPGRTLGGLILAENGFLLVAGLLLGAGAALLSISPQLLHGLGTVPWTNLGILFVVVLGVGLLAGSLAMLGTLRAPLVPALRRE
ncbi:MAG: FtsX-like permease family protein, partial [Gemmataceae bacterium]